MNKNNYLIELARSTQTDFGRVAFSMQPEAQKVFSAIWALESEVNNGGFSQYFLNDSRESASFIVEALETIGAPKTADICRRAIAAAFPDDLPQDPGTVRSLAADFPDELLE